MLVMRYRHRLPADYAMHHIRERVAARARLWDDTPGLGFKAFSVTERGRHGAAANAYASTYLWRDAAAAVAFLTGARFASVVETFGRPLIETWLPLSVQAGPLGAARFLRRETTILDAEADLDRLRAAEAEAGRIAVSGGALAVVAALDPAAWHLTRFTLSEDPMSDEGEAAEEVLHLAAPGWTQLGRKGERPCR